MGEARVHCRYVIRSCDGLAFFPFTHFNSRNNQTDNRHLNINAKWRQQAVVFFPSSFERELLLAATFAVVDKPPVIIQSRYFYLWLYSVFFIYIYITFRIVIPFVNMNKEEKIAL